VPIYSCFKYRPLNSYTFEGLERSELYFCPTGSLNDPHDCDVDLERIVDSLSKSENCENQATVDKLANDKGLLRGLREGAANLGICSYSLTHNSTLMWAHYARNHTGICLRFDFPKSFLADDEQYPFMATSAIKYGDNIVSAWIQDKATLYEKSRREFGMALTRVLLTAKGKVWEYEQEVRTIATEQGTVTIPPEYLTHAIFGLRTTSDDQDRVKAIFKEQSHRIRIGKVVRTNTDFGLDTVEI